MSDSVSSSEESKEAKLMALVARLDKEMRELSNERELLKETVDRLQSEQQTTQAQNQALLQSLGDLQHQNQELDMSVEALEISKAKAMAAAATSSDSAALKEENSALVLSLRGASMVLDELERKSKSHDCLLAALAALPPLVGQYDSLVRDAQDMEGETKNDGNDDDSDLATLFDATIPVGPERAKALAKLLKELNGTLSHAWQQRRNQLQSLVLINGKTKASLAQAEQAGSMQAERATTAEGKLREMTAQLESVHLQDEERASEAAAIAEEKANQHQKDATLRDLTRAVSSLTATVSDKMDIIRKLNMALYEAEHASAQEAERLARQHAAERARGDALRVRAEEVEQQLAQKFAEDDQKNGEIQRLGRELERAAERERALNVSVEKREEECERAVSAATGQVLRMREAEKALREELKNSRDDALLERTQSLQETVDRLRASRGSVAQQVAQMGALTSHLSQLVASGGSDLGDYGVHDNEDEGGAQNNVNDGRGVRSDVTLSVKARNLLNLDTMKPYSPVVVAFTQAEGDGENDWAYAGKTEWVQANSDADFKATVSLASYPMGPDTHVKFTVYDADGVSIQDENILGHVVVSLRQIVDSGKQHVRGMQPLQNRSKRKQKALSKAKACLLLSADVQLEPIQPAQQQQQQQVQQQQAFEDEEQALSALAAEEAKFAQLAQREISRFAKLNTALRDQITQRESELDRLSASFQRGNDDLSQENDELRQSLAEVTLQLQHARDRADELTGSLQGAQADMATRDREIADLKRTTEALTSHANRLQDLNEGADHAEIEAEVKNARIEQLQAALAEARADLKREQQVSAGLHKELQGMMRPKRQY